MGGEHGGKPPAPGAPAVGVEDGGDGGFVEQAEPLGLVDCALEGPGGDHGSEIKEGPGRGRHGESAVVGDLRGRERPTMEPDPIAALTARTARDRDVGQARVGLAEIPEVSGGTVAQNRLFAAGDQRRPALSCGRERRVTDGIHPPANLEEAPGSQAPLNRATTQADDSSWCSSTTPSWAAAIRPIRPSSPRYAVFRSI